jgi:hypothetical protein
MCGWPMLLAPDLRQAAINRAMFDKALPSSMVGSTTTPPAAQAGRRWSRIPRSTSPMYQSASAWPRDADPNPFAGRSFLHVRSCADLDQSTVAASWRRCARQSARAIRTRSCSTLLIRANGDILSSARTSAFPLIPCRHKIRLARRMTGAFLLRRPSSVQGTRRMFKMDASPCSRRT